MDSADEQIKPQKLLWYGCWHGMHDMVCHAMVLQTYAFFKNYWIIWKSIVFFLYIFYNLILSYDQPI